MEIGRLKSEVLLEVQIIVGNKMPMAPALSK
jgi:hypothetical protein